MGWMDVVRQLIDAEGIIVGMNGKLIFLASGFCCSVNVLYI